MVISFLYPTIFNSTLKIRESPWVGGCLHLNPFSFFLLSACFDLTTATSRKSRLYLSGTTGTALLGTTGTTLRYDTLRNGTLRYDRNGTPVAACGKKKRNSKTRTVLNLSLVVAEAPLTCSKEVMTSAPPFFAEKNGADVLITGCVRHRCHKKKSSCTVYYGVYDLTPSY